MSGGPALHAGGARDVARSLDNGGQPAGRPNSTGRLRRRGRSPFPPTGRAASVADVVIDGSRGEGGGQVVRTACHLAVLTQQSVRVERIRAKRATPGLRPQHAGLVQFLAHLTGAEVSGAAVGAETVELDPGAPHAGEHTRDLRTAGSVPLFLQAVLPVLLVTPGTTRLEVRGGTDTAYAPTMDWFRHVYMPRVAPVADHVRVDVDRRGFYPKGGGVVRVTVRNEAGRFSPDRVRERVAARLAADASRPAALAGVQVTSVAHERLHGVAQRQAEAAVRRFGEGGLTAQGRHEAVPARSLGSACCAWSEDARGHRMGGDQLGAQGVPAEAVGRSAATRLLEDLATGATVDRHLADHMVPWIGLGAGAVRVPRDTGHLETNRDVTNAFLDRKVRLDGQVLKAG